jgi:hypothetical protein
VEKYGEGKSQKKEGGGLKLIVLIWPPLSFVFVVKICRERKLEEADSESEAHCYLAEGDFGWVV